MEGVVAFDVPTVGNPCETWDRIVGNLSSEKPPLIVIHGGPGLTHHYILPISDLRTQYGIPVIFYDRG